MSFTSNIDLGAKITELEHELATLQSVAHEHYQPQIDELIAENNRHTARIRELEAAIRWVLNDAAYKPPEEIGDVAQRWLDRLRSALETNTTPGERSGISPSAEARIRPNIGRTTEETDCEHPLEAMNHHGFVTMNHHGFVTGVAEDFRCTLCGLVMRLSEDEISRWYQVHAKTKGDANG